MFPRLSLVIRSPLTKASSPLTMNRRMLQSSAPYTSTTQADHHSLTGSLIGMPYPELVALTRGFLTESGYRMPEHRSNLITKSLIDAFAQHDVNVSDNQRFMNSLSSLVDEHLSVNAEAAALDVSDDGNGSTRPSTFEPFTADYTVDHMLLDSLPTIKFGNSPQ